MAFVENKIKELLVQKYLLNDISVAVVEKLLQKSKDVAVLFDDEIYIKNKKGQLTTLTDHSIYKNFTELLHMQNGDLHPESKLIPLRTYYFNEKLKMMEKTLASITSKLNSTTLEVQIPTKEPDVGTLTNEPLSTEKKTEETKKTEEPNKTEETEYDDTNFDQIYVYAMDKFYTIDGQLLKKYLPNVKENVFRPSNELYLNGITSMEMNSILRALAHIHRNGSLDDFDMTLIGDITEELVDSVKFLGFTEFYDKLMSTIQLVILNCTLVKKIPKNLNASCLLPQIYIDQVSLIDSGFKKEQFECELCVVHSEADISRRFVEFNIKDVLPIPANTIKELKEKNHREHIILKEYPQAFVVDDAYLPNTKIDVGVSNLISDLALPVHRILVAFFEFEGEENNLKISKTKYHFYPPKENNCKYDNDFYL